MRIEHTNKFVMDHVANENRASIDRVGKQLDLINKKAQEHSATGLLSQSITYDRA